VRQAILVVALLFIAALATLTALDIAHYGLTALDVLAILILVVFCTGIIGALRNPPPS
jgi:hypothetical protein